MSRSITGSTKKSPNVGRKPKDSVSEPSKHPSKIKVQISPTKKLTKQISKGDLSASDALKILQEIKQEQEKALEELERKNGLTEDDEREASPVPIDKEKEIEVEEECEDTNHSGDIESFSGEMTKQQIERENKKLSKAEKDLEELRIKMEEKEIIFHKLLLELKRMSYIFNKVKEIDIRTAGQVFEKDDTKKDGRLTVEQRKELVDKGPFNLIFHGLEPDWIEEEMDDDPEFIRDVIGQRIRTMIREECGIARDVGIIDCYRYLNGAQWRGAYPVVVEFKARREKEQLLWRSKDRLRKIDIVVTDDISFRQKEEWINQAGEEPSSVKPQNPVSPKKKKKSKPTVEEELFGDFF